MRREETKSSKQDPKHTASNCSIPCRLFFSLLFCSLIHFFSSPPFSCAMSGVLVHKYLCQLMFLLVFEYELVCYSDSFHVGDAYFVFFLCASPVSMCFLLLYCFVFFVVFVSLWLGDLGFLCEMFPCTVRQQFC